MKCAIREARQVCFHLDILVAIANPHNDVISKQSIADIVLSESSASMCIKFDE